MTAAADNENKNDNEAQVEKLPYPKSVFFIIVNEFCERFSFYGMRTVLTLYLVNILLYSEEDATVIYHAFTMLVYFFPVLGAILSDSYIGKFNTIFFVSMIYAVGSIVIALSSAEPIGIPQREFCILGLLLIALGTGGIKPCVSSFGGDQFIVPQQERELARFFSLFYFSINAGSLITTFLTPVLRKDVHCFGTDSCYPLAFGVPGILMIISIVVFGLGKPLYKIRKPEGNIVVEVVKCIGHAIGQKRKSHKKLDHWLDYAEDKYDRALIEDVKATLKVLVLYTPLPIFWALYDQQGSAWTFQAVRMDGSLGSFTILPDQMQVVNPLLILAFIPLFTYWVYPLLAKCNLLKSPLQRMACGGFLAAFAFVVSASISLALEATYPDLPGSGEAQLRVYNTLGCKVSMNVFHIGKVNVDPMSYYENNLLSVEGSETFELTYLSGDCYGGSKDPFHFNIEEEKMAGVLINAEGFHDFEDDIDKSNDGNPKLRTLVSKNISITYQDEDHKNAFTISPGNWSLVDPNPDVGTYYVNEAEDKISLKLGGVYTVLVQLDENDVIKNITTLVLTEPNSIHMLLLLPQYIIITAAEIMYSITGLEFSYSQAPKSMKSVLASAWLLTTAFGNLIIVIISSAKPFERASYNFFLYSALMLCDLLLFTYLAMKYKYVTYDSSEPNSSDETELQDPTNSNGIDNPSFKKEDLKQS